MGCQAECVSLGVPQSDVTGREEELQAQSCWWLQKEKKRRRRWKMVELEVGAAALNTPSPGDPRSP